MTDPNPLLDIFPTFPPAYPLRSLVKHDSDEAYVVAHIPYIDEWRYWLHYTKLECFCPYPVKESELSAIPPATSTDQSTV